MDATDLPPWTSPPSDVPAGSAHVDHSTAASLVQDTFQHGVTASKVRAALNDDDPPIPLLHVVNHEKATEGLQLYDGPQGPPCISHGFDDSRRKYVENDAERQLPDSAHDNTPTLDSTMGTSMTKASVAVGQSMAKDVEKGNEEGGTAPPMSSRTGEVASTAAVGRDAPPARRSTSKPQRVLSFYQRKSFVSDMTCTLFIIAGLAAAIRMQLSNIQEPTTLAGTSQKLLAPEGAAGNYFQRSAAIYGDTIVFGAYGVFGDENKGSALVFVRSGESWTYKAKLMATDGAVAGDRFGESVAVNEKTIVVGAPLDDENGCGSGSAHVFVRSGEEWKHQVKLLAPDGGENDYFGRSVAIYGDTIVVGAPWDDGDNGSASGSAHAFVRSGEEWRHQAKLLAPDGAADYRFGWGVAIHGDTVAVRASWGDCFSRFHIGSAHIFVRSGEEWTHQAKLLAPDGAADDCFGSSAAIYGDTIIVGAYGDDDNGRNSGSAHAFVRDDQSWSHQAKLLAPDGAAGDYFGSSVAIYKEAIVVGAPHDDDYGDYSGSAHVFVRRGEEWKHQGKLLAPDGAADDIFGNSVAIYENTIVVGAPRDNNNGFIYNGSAHVFVIPSLGK